MSIQRRISQKQGFTLIELMVVIVIIGILAAIAIPKLFGMTAKAKAQEVGPAAGTWVKMQQAFSSEVGKLGPNYRIGYTLPGEASSKADNSTTSNFSYATTPAGAALTSPTVETADSDEAEFVATAKGNLNKCLGGSTWTVKMNNNNGSITAEIKESGSADDECIALTPQFEKLATPVAGP